MCGGGRGGGHSISLSLSAILGLNTFEKSVNSRSLYPALPCSTHILLEGNLLFFKQVMLIKHRPLCHMLLKRLSLFQETSRDS